MSFLYEVKEDLKVLVFMYALEVYVMLPLDFDQRSYVIEFEKNILLKLKKDFGREIKGLTLVMPYYH